MTIWHILGFLSALFAAVVGGMATAKFAIIFKIMDWLQVKLARGVAHVYKEAEKEITSVTK